MAAPVLKKLECPNCGTPLNQHMPDTQTIVCHNCGSQVALGMEEISIIDKAKRLPKPPVPLKIGQTFTLDGLEYFVMGRIVYEGWDDEDRWRWDEWLLGAANGRTLWLSYDEKGFGLYTKMRFRQPFNPQSDMRLPVSEDKNVWVHERYPARIIGAEGELTWRAKAGDKLYMAEGAGHGKRYSIQQTISEMEFYEGEIVDTKEIATALGDNAWLKKIEQRESRASLMALLGVICIAFAAVACVVGVLANTSGERVVTQRIDLSTGAPTATIPVDLNRTGRPAIVSLRSLQNLPVNTWYAVDVSVTSPNETKTFLFGKTFWHETGRDSDGPWVDTNYDGSDMFVPTVAGAHTVELTFADSQAVSEAALEVSVRRNHIFPLWYLVYGSCVLSIGIGLFIFGASLSSKKT